MKKSFAVYLSDFEVELLDRQSERGSQGRLICSQNNYESLLKFAKKLAFNHHLPLRNYTQVEA